MYGICSNAEWIGQCEAPAGAEVRSVTGVVRGQGGGTVTVLFGTETGAPA